MAVLRKWRRPRELDWFRREVDDLLDRFRFDRDWLKEWESIPLRPPVDCLVDGDRFIVRVDLPGVDPKEVEIKAAAGVLTIRGHRSEKHPGKGVRYLRRERRQGPFERIIQLPEGVSAEDIKASYRGGVLELTTHLPKESRETKVRVEAEKSQPGRSE
jgi:HSP20 family protein